MSGSKASETKDLKKYIEIQKIIHAKLCFWKTLIINRHLNEMKLCGFFLLLTSEAEPCGQAVVHLLHVKMKSSVEFPASFLAFPLQVGQELAEADACRYVQISELDKHQKEHKPGICRFV